MYQLCDRDTEIIDGLRCLMRKLAAWPDASAYDIVGAGKVLLVLDRLPEVSPGISVYVTLATPVIELDGDETMQVIWEVSVCDGEIEASISGWFRSPDTGPDTFTAVQWSAYPGQETTYDDYRFQHAIIPGLPSLHAYSVEQIDLSLAGYELSVEDADEIIASDDSDGQHDVEVDAEEDVLSDEGDEDSEIPIDPRPWPCEMGDDIPF